MNENKSSGLSLWFKRAALVLVVAVLFSQLNSRLRGIEAEQKRMAVQVESLKLLDRTLELSDRQSDTADALIAAFRAHLATNSPAR